ncbi:Cas10/Cmr2 second palm domain-containing protein [Limnofasciculus baicalensis]|uniref:CRISPR-associated protein Cmr2 n=1 Tax=Limnofasciculus baicalensis BBK-W-15 TaxID=2699891 RepID=A0AAE3GSA2_9CYAN|nr:type III-B CRISPR-associated protein Cas10/Cmr2 [Limnofasciculus baicalensis]MCP2729775.1 CRISPR-associated protein Cmr2 [Limnofasciculus baicalensis BBK-W-15]
MSEYTAISFAPVQGFIEKSRKLRDLFGASLILSYLSYRLVETASTSNLEVISPGCPNLQKGMPNRILLKGEREFSRNDVTNTLRKSWQEILNECRVWIEREVPPKEKYFWQQEWMRWGLYTWEIFWGHGDSIESAMKDLETRKLRRDWTAINWKGDSSSLTGTDAIAWPRLGLELSNPGRQLSDVEKDELKHPGRQLSDPEKAELKDFYQRLSCVLENLPPDGKPEGKFLDPNERLSIPELVKRLVTREDIAKSLGMETLPKKGDEQGFSDLIRMPKEGVGQWTGWFMGDGDKVGKKLQDIAKEQGDAGLKNFSEAMRDWGDKFMQDFPENLGRVVYAGGDDFLGIIYSSEPEKPPEPIDALEWLMGLPEEWKKHGQDINLSVGFVWAGHSIPQRDILQHCREAEKRAKNLGRDRVTIRVVFNSGQYVQWTCPWDYLHVLKDYRDRDGKTYSKWESEGKDPKLSPNWTHVYKDLAHLKNRHAISFNPKEEYPDDELALTLFQLYFEDRENLEKDWKHIVGDYPNPEQSKQIIYWISDLINVGWQLCSNISSL